MADEAKKKNRAVQAALAPVDAEMRQLYQTAQMRARPRSPYPPLSESDLLFSDAPYNQNTAQPTEVIGAPGLAQQVETLLTIAPTLRGLVDTVRSGPNEATFERLRGSGFGDDEYAQTNLFGNYVKKQPGFNRTEITINPRLTKFYDQGRTDDERFATLAHEFGHAAGLPHGRALNNIEGVARMRDEYLRKNGAK
jgi:hypothetical protein